MRLEFIRHSNKNCIFVLETILFKLYVPNSPLKFLSQFNMNMLKDYTNIICKSKE